MLTSIAISNFAIVESLELEFKKGMTVISGETGAGKSIMVDALSLCLGDRTDAAVVRHGEKKRILAPALTYNSTRMYKNGWKKET
ncbi:MULTISPECIES: AAA family ATPase [Marinomonas]|uniref:AAA family ATPase n=1 Tax=Marinomonas TaxID=28253 RepID=UPI002AA2A110|nr:AAA family ATPase [Marinomonas sp. KJ51-3]